MPKPPVSVSTPLLEVIRLSLMLPVPLMFDDPVSVRFSMFESSVNVTLD